MHSPHHAAPNVLARVRAFHIALLVLSGIFVVRLFYLQVIRHDYYQQAALRGQLKQYEVPAERGEIIAHNGDDTAALVLNEKRYVLYADPALVKDPSGNAAQLQKIIGGNQSEYESLMKTEDTRYQVLAKKLTREQNEKVLELKLKGIGTQEQVYRTYPQGTLAAQLLGFVNDEGKGQYGIEQALDEQLKGKPGQLKAITDAQGVPLAANRDNVVIDPEPGKKLLLSVDLSMQQQVEDILKQRVEQTKSNRGSAVVIETKTGKIKAMGTYPTYNPAEFFTVEDAQLFVNPVSGEAFEVGSIMKPLTAAAALDQGVVNSNTSYYDPASYVIDEATVRNIEEDGGPGTKTVADILQLSLNTGAAWLLMQMGGGEINQQARERWHDYMINRYLFASQTGVEQGDESTGWVPDPNDGFGLNIRFANTAFGQGQTQTMIQMAGAISAVVNGGTYYRPTLVDGYVQEDGSVEYTNPAVLKSGVVNESVSEQMQRYMEYTIEKNKPTYGVNNLNGAYSYGGKTGTAQIASPEGGYYEDKYNGTFMGYVGGDDPEYVIVVWMREPTNITGYAGAKAAAPVYFDIANVLTNNFGIKPKS
jgi:cell division protein FtsI/penicillin-binding protein 2